MSLSLVLSAGAERLLSPVQILYRYVPLQEISYVKLVYISANVLMISVIGKRKCLKKLFPVKHLV